MIFERGQFVNDHSIEVKGKAAVLNQLLQRRFHGAGTQNIHLKGVSGFLQLFGNQNRRFRVLPGNEPARPQNDGKSVIILPREQGIHIQRLDFRKIPKAIGGIPEQSQPLIIPGGIGAGAEQIVVGLIGAQLQKVLRRSCPEAEALAALLEDSFGVGEGELPGPEPEANDDIEIGDAW